MVKLFKHLKKYSILIICILILAFVQVMADLNLPNLMSRIVDTGIVKGDVDYIIKIGGYMLIIALGGTFASILLSLLSAKVSVGFAKDLREKVFTHVENFSLNEFDKLGTSSLITRTTNDITQVQQVMVMMLRIAVIAPIMCIGGLFMALSKDVPLSITFLITIPLLIIVIGIVGFKGLPLFKSIQVKIDKLNRVVREGLTGIRVVRAFNRTEYEEQRFDEASKDLTETSIRVNKIMASLMPIMMLIFNFMSIGIIWFGAKRIDMNAMQVGDLMAFLQYSMQVMMSVVMVSIIFVMVPRASASAERINEVLNMKPVISNSDNTKKPNGKKGYLEFKNVVFRYPGAEQAVLNNISFITKPGETTAIIGSTGSGKSALVNLIPRFYDIEEGSILLDGVDIREMEQEDLRDKIGIVPQKAVLFSGTVAENIRYGKENATDEEIKHAAKIAQASEFISKMKDGYDSQIAQGGNNLSGGQKQRLSIARAIVKKPEIYIFDDSFSALDFKTDANLREALKSEIKESTMIIVAQRVSTVMNADRIIVLDEGNIAGIGTHEELLKSSKVYKEIVSSQLAEEEIA
ncbi:ATP-binding cassette subfamily B protein [Clostridium tetanomorphum]|uniref:ABC transporter ATP-binding protein n=1 Tax=Clostridium tetanomorphum TaxID=1553 RepID=A0A923J1S9_CLOTT|nr:ABC transporter ATP-binding protein [Clostridium tetanomorphum]KAJ51116.1 ABC transporter-like protein [Clostridium tetanomorphum DSM 665]MBC2398035.1 ABC transporter ATP-binding protein [Clostridium tetanomorphum]MBP1864456.1 ATP-binding cassette subfamily B protein [Clostridium tetanomorphum]NRS83013.1 ATP-binding cassette subfamily B protein [Clostridium tetanomorphum]NRZ98891.1 ATP-binding cassette subfamily B protein [Clostridium tetanomorphum]